MGEMQTFGQWFRHHRRELDLTQAELSQRVGCAPITIRKIEADEMRPSKQLAELLLDQLGVSVEDRENFIRFARGGELALSVAAAVPRHNLPHPLSSFIGRQREIAEVKRLIGSSRLMTLTGVGGGGKTRLGLQVARDLVDTFADGVWWVELAAVTDPALVPHTIAKVYSLREEPNQETGEILANFLHDKQLLIVIDNCEHLITDCARLFESLLSKCVNLRILATSREPLGISGETVYQVTPLSLPGPNETSLKRSSRSEAARLFVDRAAAAKPGFEITKQNVAAVVRICQTLDGIPLAIELAAARVKLLTVQHIAERLDKRFDLLTTGSRTALPRQQTLRAAIDWSYELLSEKAKMLFHRLSVFSGGFGREAAEAVCFDESLPAGTVFTELSRLVDRSLVEVVQTGQDERYRMLETIRLYAAERLQESGEQASLRNRHLAYFMQWAEKVEPGMRGPEQMAWWERMEIDHDNIRTTLEWSLNGGDVQTGLRLAGAAVWFWTTRGYDEEGLRWLRALLAKTGSELRTPWRAKALLGIETLIDFPAGKAALQEALGIWRELEDGWWISLSLVISGWQSLYQRDIDTALTQFREAVDVAKFVADKWALANALRGLGAAIERVDFSAARPVLEESVAIWREVGDKVGLAEALSQIGSVARAQKDYERAAVLHGESLNLFRQVGFKGNVADQLIFLGFTLQRQGENARAVQFLKEGMLLAKDLRSFADTATSLVGFGGVAGGQNEPRRAARLFGAAESILKSVGLDMSVWPQRMVDYNDWTASARAQLGEETYAASFVEGQAMSLEQAVRYALEDTREV